MSARIFGLLAIVLGSSACHTMQPMALSDLETTRPARVWVTRADQSVVIVEGPQIVRNRLAGFVDGVYQVMPMEAVQAVRVRRTDARRTAVLVTGANLSDSDLSRMCGEIAGG